jgi:hypothetical protein
MRHLCQLFDINGDEIAISQYTGIVTPKTFYHMSQNIFQPTYLAYTSWETRLIRLPNGTHKILEHYAGYNYYLHNTDVEFINHEIPELFDTKLRYLNLKYFNSIRDFIKILKASKAKAIKYRCPYHSPYPSTYYTRLGKDFYIVSNFESQTNYKIYRLIYHLNNDEVGLLNLLLA